MIAMKRSVRLNGTAWIFARYLPHDERQRVGEFADVVPEFR
jgi:hypothetical protein